MKEAAVTEWALQQRYHLHNTVNFVASSPATSSASGCYSDRRLREVSDYWRIEVNESDPENTAFFTPDGLYEFQILPFSLNSGPATFQRPMDTVLPGLMSQTSLVYLDDVIVFSLAFEAPSSFEAIRLAGLTLKPEKRHFSFHELQFLGYIASSQEIRPDPDKNAAVVNFPTPSDEKLLRRFLGLWAYYQWFIANSLPTA